MSLRNFLTTMGPLSLVTTFLYCKLFHQLRYSRNVEERGVSIFIFELLHTLSRYSRIPNFDVDYLVAPSLDYHGTESVLNEFSFHLTFFGVQNSMV